MLNTEYIKKEYIKNWIEPFSKKLSLNIERSYEEDNMKQLIYFGMILCLGLFVVLGYSELGLGIEKDVRSKSIENKSPGMKLQGSDSFHFFLKPHHKMQINEIARLIVQTQSKEIIQAKTRVLLESLHRDRDLRMSDKTQGAESSADEAGLEALKRQAEKEIGESEREKDEQMSESQLEHIKKLMDMIKEMFKLHSRQVDGTLTPH